MGVGDLLQIQYRLRGALPAGNYHLVASGYQPGGDAKLHADIVWKNAQGVEKVILSLDSNIPQGSDAGLPGSIEGDFHGDAVPAACGDQLLLKIKFVSGTMNYIEFSASLKIP